MSFYHTVMHPKDADGIANSVDPDLGLHLHLGSLWYILLLYLYPLQTVFVGGILFSRRPLVRP